MNGMSTIVFAIFINFSPKGFIKAQAQKLEPNFPISMHNLWINRNDATNLAYSKTDSQQWFTCNNSSDAIATTKWQNRPQGVI